jgi:hypothetical protein
MNGHDFPPKEPTPAPVAAPASVPVAPAPVSFTPSEDTPIAEVTLALVPGVVEGTKVISAPHVDEEKAARVREILVACGCKTAVDIGTLGCTGVVAGGFTIEDAKLVRLGVAGSGVGLTCFVPPDRFCLVHQTIGGLQEGQASRHAQVVPDMSRDLTPAERAKVAFTEHARRIVAPSSAARFAAVRDLLSGRRDVPEEVRAELARMLDTGEDAEDTDDDEGDGDAIPPVFPSPPAQKTVPWTCDVHAETDWACRFCAAAEIVRGPYTPVYVFVELPDGAPVAVTSAEIEGRVAGATGAAGAALFVRAAKWVRKLARE